MKRITKFIVLTILSLLAVEIALRVIDPWGIVYFDDLNEFRAFWIPEDSGYAYMPGTWHVRNRAFTILDDGTRKVPGRLANGPRVMFYGDSVTFGLWVEDGEAWPSLVAERLGLDAANHGRVAYNIDNLLPLIRRAPDGCLVFLSISNDTEPPVVYQPRLEPNRHLWLLRYIAAGSVRRTPPVVDALSASQAEAFAEIAARPDTLILSFDDSYGEILHDNYGAAIFPRYSNTISFIDRHANAAGNREIADAVTPILAAWLAERECG